MNYTKKDIRKEVCYYSIQLITVLCIWLGGKYI